VEPSNSVRISNSTNIENYVNELQERLLNIHDLVRESLNLANDKMKARYDLGANSGGFQKDDKVCLFNPHRKKGKSRKLTPSFGGTFLKSRKMVHLDRLKKYQGLDEADRDDQQRGTVLRFGPTMLDTTKVGHR